MTDHYDLQAQADHAAETAYQEYLADKANPVLIPASTASTAYDALFASLGRPAAPVPTLVSEDEKKDGGFPYLWGVTVYMINVLQDEKGHDCFQVCITGEGRRRMSAADVADAIGMSNVACYSLGNRVSEAEQEIATLFVDKSEDDVYYEMEIEEGLRG